MTSIPDRLVGTVSLYAMMRQPQAQSHRTQASNLGPQSSSPIQTAITGRPISLTWLL